MIRWLSPFIFTGNVAVGVVYDSVLGLVVGLAGLFLLGVEVILEGQWT